MKKYFHLRYMELPLYKGHFVIVLTNSKKKIEKFVPERKGRTLFAFAYHSNFKGKEAFFIVLNCHHKKGKITHGVITHEAIHAALNIAYARGVKLDIENDEPITYLAEWITNQTYKFIKKKKFKIS